MFHTSSSCDGCVAPSNLYFRGMGWRHKHEHDMSITSENLAHGCWIQFSVQLCSVLCIVLCTCLPSFSISPSSSLDRIIYKKTWPSRLSGPKSVDPCAPARPADLWKLSNLKTYVTSSMTASHPLLSLHLLKNIKLYEFLCW